MNVSKIERDPYYYLLYQKYGLQYILEAGFFFDEVNDLDLEESLKIACTPINHINKPTTEKHCVILTTGAMDPVHQGHVDMMVIARAELKKQGYEVLGGYICPSHDSYVSKKNNVSNNVNIRNVLISEITKDINWLALDPWGGTFVSSDINFTDVIERTKKYLLKYLNLDTEVIYVCGSDNWKFSRTFIDKCKCVIVTRPDYFVQERYRNSYLAMGENSMSSTKIRQAYNRNINISNYVKNLVLRDDGTPLLTDVFKKYFSEVTIVSVADQRKEFFKLELDNVVSLDSLIYGKYFFRTSRKYDLFGHTKIGWHGANNNLPNEEIVVLYDDDIHTGNTMNYVSQQLKFNHDKLVIDQLSFNTSPNYEKLDNRDFIAFGENSGLVVQFGDLICRVPYIYPFVDPMIRCSITDPLQFSIDVWQANVELFEDQVLSDYPQLAFYTKLGFNSDTLVKDICQFYCDYLTKLQNN